MRRLLKGLFGLIFVVVPLLVIAAGLGALWLSRSLPPAVGNIVVEGLDGPVTIARDEAGVPHIRGESRADVFAGLGFAHAQDRLWQMEMARMAGQGRLSEMFGEPTLGTDVWLRTVAIYEASVASYERFPEEAKQALEAYARGVNAWIEREPRIFSSKLPPEFVILGHEPEPWRPEHSVAVVKMMSVGLAANIADEVERLAFARAGLSPEEIDDLLPLLPDLDAPPLPNLNTLLEIEEPLEQAALDVAPADAIEMVGLTGRGASNNWVVSGERTDTGMPILANDPHLDLTAPSIWYLAHLRVEDEAAGAAENLVGATLAGAPLVLLGRNDDVAWGFTNTGSDVQDLFVERINPEDPEEYRTPSGWTRFGTAEEVIGVKGQEDYVFTRRWTRHGPVMPPEYRNLGQLLPDGMVAALAWIALAEDDTTMLAGLAVWDFQTVEDYQEGMADFVTPMQSIVIADTQGNIGLLAPGRVPVRDPENDVMGRAPVPGWDATYDWKGTIPYEDLPRIDDPAAGAIGTANTRIVGDDYEPLLTLDWDEPYRQDRVDALIIESEDVQSVETSRAALADVYSPAFAELLPQMLAAVEGSEAVDPFAVAALGDWDFRMDRSRAEPLIAQAWLREATRAIFADDLGNAFPRWFQARGQVIANVLAGRGDRDWCDVRDTSETEDCGTVLAAALDDGLSMLRERHGEDMSAWRWGEAHVALSEHRPFGAVPPLDRFFNISIESGGGAFTLNRGRMDWSDEEGPFINRHAASFRAIYDLADLDSSQFMITTGQSGNVFSGHYKDLAEPWRDVEAVTIATDPADYNPQTTGVWQMLP